MLRELVKWDYELRLPEQAAELVDRALAIAMSPPMGPVYLSLPREVLCAEIDGADAARDGAPAADGPIGARSPLRSRRRQPCWPPRAGRW